LPQPGHALWKITKSKFWWSNRCITQCSDEWSGILTGLGWSIDDDV
jgi:hypothetical protein